jgi:shikimate dehydrogenase
MIKRAFVIGYPIKHSRSPLIHGHWLKQYGLDGAYEKIKVSPEALPSFLRKLDDQGFVGGNVTIPHKEAVMALCSTLSQTARMLGAVNTLWRDGQHLFGDNTDGIGFIANLDQNAPDWSHNAAHALVLGAGGASRAIIHGLLSRGVERISLVNRTLSRAEEVASLFGPRVMALAWSDVSEVLPDVDLIVNTTSLGMAGQPPLELDLDRVKDTVLVTDIVYVPLETPVLTKAKARGLKTVDGLGMLLHQAVPGFERWFGQKPTVTPELRALIVEDIIKPHG